MGIIVIPHFIFIKIKESIYYILIIVKTDIISCGGIISNRVYTNPF